MRISKVQIAECSMPLPYILRLGSTEISTRDYVLFRVETDSGLYGEAIGYPRGAPLFEILFRIAQQAIGADPLMRRELMVRIEHRNIPGRAALTRGLSLMDIALWDIACKNAKEPLYRFLGGLRPEAQVTAVAGYYMDRRSIDDIADEVTQLCDEGYSRVKIMLKGNDPDFDRSYAQTVSQRAPGRVAADAHWSWTTITEAMSLCRDLDEMGLNFLEDPFAANDVRYTHDLRNRMKTPIAAGEDVFGPSMFADLVSGIDVLRVDATTCGGITGAVEAINLAAAGGKTVFPHVFSPLHIHLACAFLNVEAVELITEASGADPLQLLLKDLPKVEGGRMKPSDEPGAGVHIHWEAVGKMAKRMVTLPAAS